MEAFLLFWPRSLGINHLKRSNDRRLLTQFWEHFYWCMKQENSLCFLSEDKRISSLLHIERTPNNWLPLLHGYFETITTLKENVKRRSNESHQERKSSRYQEFYYSARPLTWQLHSLTNYQRRKRRTYPRRRMTGRPDVDLVAGHL
jgi:hypothetical protein